MASLPDERSAARFCPGAVARAVRAAVGLLADHPEDLGAGLDQNLALLLDRGRVDPVLRVEQLGLSPTGGGYDPVAGRERLLQHRGLRGATASKRRLAGAKGPR